MLEAPVPGATASGIGLVFGWHCTASRIDIQIDGGAPLRAAQGTTRPDTMGVCANTNSGFGLTFNWARLTPGIHTIRALADGVEFAQTTFTVATYGAEFLSGKAATVTVPDFPSPGRSSVLEWREATQSFVMREVLERAPFIGGRWNGADLERRSACSQPQNDGDRGTYAQYDVTAGGDGFSIQETGVTGLACTYNARWKAGMEHREAAGSYTCNDGKHGDFTTTEITVLRTQMSIRMAVKLSGAETCTVDKVIGGARLAF